MGKLEELMADYLREQIGLEEHLCKVIEQHIEEVNDDSFPEAKKVLIDARTALERQFTPLNQLLDSLEREEAFMQGGRKEGNGLLKEQGGLQREKQAWVVSRILRDDYAALNLITISNTLLHTTALALNRDDIASIALSHLKSLAPIVIRLGELLPGVVARELQGESDLIDLSIAEKALLNTKNIWRGED